MANKMLIDASHPEETRVVVLRGNRVEEFDFEAASKKQLRGNIYLAKVTRVEPSLQAAFVDYGGNRHGFLAFSEIHPDYYQIPVVDRQALIEEEARAQRDEDDDEAGQRRSRRFRRGDRDGRRAEKRSAGGETVSESDSGPQDLESAQDFESAQDLEGAQEPEAARELVQAFEGRSEPTETSAPAGLEAGGVAESPHGADETPAESADFAAGCEVGAFGNDAFSGEAESRHEGAASDEAGFDRGAVEGEAGGEARAFAPDEPESGERGEAGAAQDSVGSAADDAEARSPDRRPADEDGEDEDEHVEQLGGDAMEDIPARPQRYRKQYKIQEVIKRRQVLLVQVVKEERGNKGAALTTYLSLAGRYSVLMPNTARGGGISRKITDSTDRQRLKSIAQELEVPEGMGVILRTAGASRTKPEVKRDFEYLLRMWETVRETTLKSTAPTLVYEEGSLIKRAIRDLYNKDIDDIVVAGEQGFREARDFMRLLMPSHVRSVQAYRDPQPIFAKSGVEAQLDAMFVNQVTLKSGGYIVINQTEALVAIDVNSGRSTREHNIEDTALRTNLEAADEITRQLRLRDLAGLIVIDFIDMEEGRNNRAVERRLKDALKNDRARIQVGRISHFGLLEMSRQRIRTGVLEGSTEICPHCSGSGMLRSTASIALHVLRVAEDALIKSASHDLVIRTRTPVALYILNEKRAHLRDLERRFGVAVTIAADDSLIGNVYHALERGEPASGGHEPLALAPSEPARIAVDDFIENAAADSGDIQDIDAQIPLEAGRDEDIQDEGGERREGESESEADSRRRRKRRRRRGRGGDREGSGIAANAPQPPDDALEVMARIGKLQPVLATPQPSAEAPFDADVAFSADVADFEERTVSESVETEQASIEDSPRAAEAEAAPAKSGKRRRPRRSAKAREAQTASEVAQEIVRESGEQAPELALEASAGGEATDADGEAVAAPRRSRRAPRARAPRRSIASGAEATALEAEASPPEAHDAAAESAGAPLFERAPDGDALQEQRRPSPIETAEPVRNLEPARNGALPESESSPQHQDPARPKRSGWWQRAKASLGR
ncbi:Rne/Rng family ribonuclease [Methylocella sp.]|jgi:ribonuclease E|uniref:Rne/Rng family ribonuclease n=1 Tax=Methylocella sp. TaxID=1978226 RepID=UPI003C1434EB